MNGCQVSAACNGQFLFSTEWDDGEYLVSHGGAHDLILALDELEELPDDHPACQLSPAGKAEWALRRLLGAKE